MFSCRKAEPKRVWACRSNYHFVQGLQGHVKHHHGGHPQIQITSSSKLLQQDGKGEGNGGGEGVGIEEQTFKGLLRALCGAGVCPDSSLAAVEGQAWENRGGWVWLIQELLLMFTGCVILWQCSYWGSICRGHDMLSWIFLKVFQKKEGGRSKIQTIDYCWS